MLSDQVNLGLLAIKGFASLSDVISKLNFHSDALARKAIQNWDLLAIYTQKRVKVITKLLWITLVLLDFKEESGTLKF